MAASIRDDIKSDNPRLEDEELSYLMRDAVLLLPRGISTEMRQYADIPLAYYVYYTNNYQEYQTEAESKLQRALYDSLYREKKWTADDIIAAADRLNIDYIAIGSDTAKENADQIPKRFEPIFTGARYTLYKTNSAGR